MTELPCYNRKEPRVEGKKKEMMFSICKCGHYSHRHDKWPQFLWGMWVWIFSLGKYGGACEDCSCNFFNRLCKCTYEEAGRLKPCEESK